MFCVQALCAQERKITFEHVAREQGLSQSEVMCIIQDHTGFLWIGTQDGLNRYDGYSFTAYKHSAEDSNSLHDNYIQALCEDRAGKLWIGTRGALHRFDPAHGTFRQYRHDPADERTISSEIISSICQDGTGTLWVGTDRGLNRFCPETQDFIRYVHNPTAPASLGSDAVTALYADRTGAVWIGTDLGLDRFDAPKTQFMHYGNGPGTTRGLHSSPVRELYEDREGTLWIGTAEGLNTLDRTSGQFTRRRNGPAGPDMQGDGRVNAISEDQTGMLWIGTDNGVCTVDRQRNAFTRYVHDPEDPASLAGRRVNAIQSEPSGTVWIGTHGGGLNKVDRNKEQFAHILREPGNPAGLSSNLVWSVFEDGRGFLWIGTDEGLNRFDRRTGTTLRYMNRAGDAHSLSSNAVYSILETRNGDFWVGTDHGLNLLDRATGRCRRFPANAGDTTALVSSTIFSLFEDHLGTLWIGTSGGGLFRFHHAGNGFTRVGPPGAIVSRIFEDHQGTLWVCTWITGLLRFDPATGRFIRYLHDPADSASISHNTVYAIQETFDEGRPILWVGTRNGLNRLDPATGRFTHYHEKDGLPGDLIYGVLPDDAGDLWLSTQNGLARFDPRSARLQIFDVSDGLQGNDFSFGAFHRSRSGELFFGGVNGVTAFRRERIRGHSLIPPVVVTAFKVFDKQLPGVHALADGDSVQLTYRDNFFSFEFAALHFSNPQRNQYAYKLEGFDEEWIRSGSRRYASYTNLPPGAYVFRVKAANPSGVWNEQGVSVRLFITPPLWQTWWAYSLLLVLGLSALYLVRRYEMNRIRLTNQLALETVQADRLKELDRLKSRFFADISHEFRTPLALILGQTESVMASRIETKEKEKLQVAYRNARRLLHLINQLLDLSKIEAGSMELRAERHDLVAFLKSIVYSFESLAQQQKIALTWESDRDSIGVLFEPEKMEMVLYNLLSNAFKFTPAGGSVSVSLETSELQSDGLTGNREPPGKEPRGEGPGDKKAVAPSGDTPPPDAASSGVVEIRVRDTGIGIPADQVPHIFDRFYQVHNPQTREHEGSGIGLALTKELVELHHGTISVNSTEGRDTEFVVRLPVQRTGQPARSPADATPRLPVRQENTGDPGEERAADGAEAGAAVSGKIVLIVEDNADVRAYIREQLEGSYRVLEATDGLQGFARAQETIPDLIITDVMMPQMDGYRFTSCIRGDEKTSHIPLVMLTAKAGLDDRLEGLEKGVDVYLTKPFSARELTVQVRNLILRREELRRRFTTATIIQPSSVAATSVDKVFLEKVIACVESHFEDEGFSVDGLAEEANMSVSQLNRKLHALIDQPAGELIRSMRLQRAADLLKQRAGTVAEISYKLGFTDQAYFSRAFKKQFGCTPSDYRSSNS